MNKKYKNELKYYLSVFILIILLTLSIIYSINNSNFWKYNAYLAAINQSLSKDIFFKNYDEIINTYETALRKKDKYLLFLRKETDFQDYFLKLISLTKSKFGFIYKNNKIIYVLEHSKNKNKIKKNDIIIQINNIKINKDNQTSLYLLKLLLTKENKINLKIKRNNKIINTTLYKSKLKPSYCEKINNSTYKITIYYFNPLTVQNLFLCFKNIKNNKNIKNIIFNLKFSPGGNVKSLSTVLSFLIQKNKLLFYEKRKNNTIYYYSIKDQIINLNNYNIKIYKSNMTASSSEIFIAVLKYFYPNIKLIGPKTYGKFTTIIPIKFSKGGIVLSIGRIYLPNGKTYENIGL